MTKTMNYLELPEAAQMMFNAKIKENQNKQVKAKNKLEREKRKQIEIIKDEKTYEDMND